MIKINETSTYIRYIEPIPKYITSEGYFNLSYIQSLHFYAGDFLKRLRKKEGITLNKFSEKYNISRAALYHWEHDRSAVPIRDLIKIIRKEQIYSLLEQNTITFRKTKFPIKLNEFKKYLKYLFPASNHSSKIIIRYASKRTISILSNKFNPKKTVNGFYINSVELHEILRKFFRYKIIYKIKPPLTKFIDDIPSSIDLRRAIICPLIQTDGSGSLDKYKKNRGILAFKNINEELHKILVDAIYKTYNVLPTSYLLLDKIKDQKKHSTCYVTRYSGINFQKIYLELLNLCGDFNTSTSNKAHLRYLLYGSKEEQRLAIRLWADTEGAIIAMRRKKNGLIVPKLQISCASSTIIRSLKSICVKFGLNFQYGFTKIGYKSLHDHSISTMLNFLKIGGFTANIKIGKNSKYYSNISKQDLSFAILEFMVRERENSELRYKPLKEQHSIIRNIAKDKKFRDLDHYIHYFSKNEKVRRCLIN